MTTLEEERGIPMRNVVLIASLFVACGPLPNNPPTTESDTQATDAITDGGTVGATDGATTTSDNPTTEVNGSTGMPDTDDPVITTLPTTTSTTGADLPPACDTPVMCGDGPCLDLAGNPICAPSFCWPMACDDCPGTCGEVDGVGSVCIIDDTVPCAPECEQVPCDACPNDLCNLAGFDLCLNDKTGEIVCKDELLECENLHDACTEDAHCAGGAPNCIEGLCRAACSANEDCGLDSTCAIGVCTDVLGNNACKITPHDSPPPPPACEPNGQCMNDLDCPSGATLCWDFTTMAPVVAGEIGNCVAPCAGPGECAEGDMCATLGFCVNRAMEPTCLPE